MSSSIVTSTVSVSLSSCYQTTSKHCNLPVCLSPRATQRHATVHFSRQPDVYLGKVEECMTCYIFCG